MGQLLRGQMLGTGFEKQIYHDNHTEFEQKVHSQYAKYLNELPFFTEYFHVIKALTTKDTGLLNVDKITGDSSPIRYNLIKDFPLFGLEQIQLELQDDDDVGLQTEYEGEAIILPQTITPLPDDCFIMTALGKRYLFRVIEIHYDTILDKNYYKISFVIKGVDNEYYYQDYLKKVVDTFICVYDNYGTQDAFLIKEENFQILDKLQKMADEVSKKYMTFFYNEKYNALMVKNPHGSNMLYDAYVNYFCNEREIFAQNPRNLWNYKFYVETRPEFEFYYNASSIQSVVINKDIELIQSPRFMRYYDTIPTFTDSIFQFYGDFDTAGITISERHINPFGRHIHPILPEELITAIQTNEFVDTTNLIYNVLVKYINNDIESVGKLLGNFNDKIRVRPIYSDYVLIPLFLYIIYQYKKSITTSNKSYMENESLRQSLKITR